MAATDIAINAGRDLVVQSRQNVATSESSGWNASVTVGPTGITGFSFGGSQADANRVYTDTPTTIIAENSLDIYTEGTTYLLGAVLDSKTGNLKLDTGDFIFDNFNDVDQSEAISGGIKLGLDGGGVSSFGTEAFSYAYTDLQAVTYATVGAGEIIVRNTADGAGFDFRDLNRDVSAVQRLVRDESFAINLPAIELSALVENIEQATAFGEGLAREAAFLKRAHLLDEREIAAIRQGYAGEELRRLVNSRSFRNYIRLRARVSEAVARFELNVQENAIVLNCVLGIVCEAVSTHGLSAEVRAFIDENVVTPLAQTAEEYQLVTRTIGLLQLVGGGTEVVLGTAGAGVCAAGSGGTGAIVCGVGGTVVVIHGFDNVQAGWNALVYGESGELISSYVIRQIGDAYDISPAAINTLVTANEFGLINALAAGALARNAAKGLGLGGARSGANGVVGFTQDTVGTAFDGLRGGGGHATRHFIDEGFISNSGSLQSRVSTFKDLTSGILTTPSKTFNWKLGDIQSRGFAGQIDGKPVVIFVAKEGPFQGKVLSAIVPDANQITQWGLR